MDHTISTKFYDVLNDYDGFLEDPTRSTSKSMLIIRIPNYDAIIKAVEKSILEKGRIYIVDHIFQVLWCFDYSKRGVPKWNPPGL